MRFWSVQLLLAIGVAAPALAQTLPADKMLEDMLAPSAVPSNISPTTKPVAPLALEPEGYSPPGLSGLLREDSDVIARAGHLVKSTEGPYSEFVFDNKRGEIPLAPMLVLPNLQLMSMEDAGAVTGGTLTFTVSGRVSEYNGRNYILLEPGPEELSEDVTIPSKSQPASAQSASSSKPRMSADEMLNQMLAQKKQSSAQLPKSRNLPPAVDATSGSAAVAPGAPVLTVLRERTQIIDRVCRLSRTSDGSQAQLTFDSDGASMQDPPVIILPNLKLGAIEAATGGDVHDPQFRVTGTLTEYRGRNYIILQKVVVMPASGRQF